MILNNSTLIGESAGYRGRYRQSPMLIFDHRAERLRGVHDAASKGNSGGRCTNVYARAIPRRISLEGPGVVDRRITLARIRGSRDTRGKKLSLSVPLFARSMPKGETSSTFVLLAFSSSFYFSCSPIELSAYVHVEERGRRRRQLSSKRNLSFLGFFPSARPRRLRLFFPLSLPPGRARTRVRLCHVHRVHRVFG